MLPDDPRGGEHYNAPRFAAIPRVVFARRDSECPLMHFLRWRMSGGFPVLHTAKKPVGRFL